MRRALRGPRRCLALLALLAALGARAQPPAEVKYSISLPFVPQGAPPWCSPAAVVMAAHAQGARLDLQALVRTLPVAADGVAWIDLRAALAPGLEVLAFSGDLAAARAAIQAGLPPILSVRRGAGRHAVVAVGLAGDGLAVLDPATGPGRLSFAALAAVWEEQPMVVVLRAGARIPGLPLARWRAAAARAAARGWARRAAAAGRTAAALPLYERALAEDPTDGAVRYDQAVLWAVLGRPTAEICAALDRAARDGAPPAAVAQARPVLGCGP